MFSLNFQREIGYINMVYEHLFINFLLWHLFIYGKIFEDFRVITTRKQRWKPCNIVNPYIKVIEYFCEILAKSTSLNPPMSVQINFIQTNNLINLFKN